MTEKYFDEQLERIREIRASERKFYQKITVIQDRLFMSDFDKYMLELEETTKK